MLTDLNNVLEKFQNEIEQVKTLDDLNRLKGKYIGRKGQLNDLFKEITQLSPDEKKDLGQKINHLKGLIDSRLQEKLKELTQKLKPSSKVDISLPGKKSWVGSLHPIQLTCHQILTIFHSLGFRIESGPEIESEYYNFEALNFPPDHPARDAQDSFFLDEEYLLRTHTSPAQIRIMQKLQPPFKVVVPGKCFRRDAMDASHSPMFHQVEGLVVAESISMGDLKGTIEIFARRFFGSDRQLRFRPSFFPFTEPSAEVDISCGLCQGKGCRSCGQTGWLEIMGAGLVHPKVFENAGYDPHQVRGFAFGMGIDRAALLKFDIPDIRWLFENDMSFIEQFQAIQ
ncbi:phenylalanine--tRNA ligase subunit alpha [Atribacter laminatus]|jgi:phenylalanyl-tRNA synthetase alpha chain|uniref:Phenylalanine--tRNA ligase alpha subunit n=1 Tax=Atribacter laminatus TaxID=2847778 RepID=A0A7T1ANN9_ATRLM|nr:phenylalanine--tRNA ligase subunit alpha [Atribacter laminatus]QPM69249.1 Phenylalanine--tRNA ligase alpha subunit [Atribacter laminatus]